MHDPTEATVALAALDLAFAGGLPESARQLLAQLTDTVMVTEAVYDLPGPRIVYVNPAFEQLTGYALAEVVGMTPRMLQGPETERAELDRIRQALQTGQPVRAEVTNYDKQGSEIYLELEISKYQPSPDSPLFYLCVGRDITQRYLNNRALSRQAERLRLALSGGDLGFWDWDFGTGELVVNERWLDILGLDTQEHHLAMGVWEERVHPEDVPRLGKILQDTILNPEGGNFEIELRARHADGTYRWILERGSVVERDRDGAPLRVSGTHMDITDRKGAELMRYRHAEILDHISDAAIGTDPEFRITSWNRAAEVLYGWRAEEAKGRVLDELLDSDFIGTTMMAAQQVLLTTGSWSGELRQTCRDGRMVIVEATVMQLKDIDGMPAGGITVNHDVTALRLAEEALKRRAERFETLLDVSDGVVWEADARLQSFLFVSSNVVRIFGYPEHKWLRPGFWAEHVHPDDLPAALGQWRSSIDRRQNFQSEYRLRHAEGQYVWVRTYVKLGFENDRLVRLSGLLVDITRSKLEEEHARRQEQEHREAQKLQAIGTLSAGIAHELNNMLAAVIGNSELALMDLTSEHPAERSVQEVYASALKGRAVLKQILAFSRPQAISRERINLRELISDTIDFISVMIPPSVTIQAAYEGNDANIIGDLTQIQQVLVNLINNAVQALPETGGLIRIRLDSLGHDDLRELEAAGTNLRVLERLHWHGELACLSVADNGYGMAPEVVTRIFEPFFTTKPSGKGTGLGMSVVHGIVESHDGLIQVDSTEGAGTRVSLYFPLTTERRLHARQAEPESVSGSPQPPPATALPPPPEAQDEEALPDTASYGEAVVMLVDDNVPILSVMERVMRRRGLRVRTFTSAETALAFAREGLSDVDLLVTDHLMPGKSGLDLAERLRELQPALPIIITTGHVTEEVMTRARALGQAEVVPKGESSQALMTAVARMLSPRGEPQTQPR